MRGNRWKIVLGAEGLVCLLPALLLPAGAELLPALAAFPLEPLGAGLRALSLSGGAGNGAAVALYLLLSLLPLGWLGVKLLRRKPLYWEDGLLVLLSALLFYVLYRMVNPGALAARFGSAAMGKLALEGTVWSVLAAFLILRLLRAFGGGEAGLLSWLDRLLGAVCLLLTAALIWTLVHGARAGLDALAAANTTVPAVSAAFAVARAAIEALPAALELWVIFAAFPLTAALAADPFGGAVAPAAEGLARRCRGSLAVLVLAQAGFNLAQLLAGGANRSSSFWVQIPLFDLGVVLAVLLAARYLARSRAIKEENDSFV